MNFSQNFSPLLFFKTCKYVKKCNDFVWTQDGSYLLHPTTFHPRTLILNFSSLYFIPSNSSFLFNPHDFSFTNSSPTFYPTPCNPFQIICYISYPLNSNSSKSSFLFNPLDFSFTNSSPTFYPTPCNLFQIICYISYPLNSYSSK